MGRRTPTKNSRNLRIMELRERGLSFEEISKTEGINVTRQRAHEIYAREKKREKKGE